METPVLSDLLDLQEVDLQIDRLLDRRQSLPELDLYRAAHAARTAAEARRDEIGDQLRVLERELDKAEGELAILEGRLKESETRLFAGGMSARETEHKRLEVRSLQGQREGMEERVLTLLDRKDELDGRLRSAQAEVADASTQEESLEGAITARWREIDAQIAREEEKKADIVRLIPGDMLELYETLRRTKEGVAIGRMEGGQCGGCHLHLSATERADAVKTDPPRCPHCRRILVV